MNKVQDVVQIHPPHGFAEPPAAEGAGPSAAVAPSQSAAAATSSEEAAKSRKRRKNSGSVVPHSMAVDTGPMGE